MLPLSMQSTIHHRLKRGFTLLEILVAITIMTLLMVGGIGFFQDMNRRLSWKKFTEDFGRNFWSRHALALTQTSLLSGDQAPEEHHLYFEAGKVEETAFVLDHLELAQSSFPAALITFDQPFASLSFRGLSSPWSETDPLPLNVAACESNCSLTFFYSRPGSQETRTILLDSAKHLEFSF